MKKKILFVITLIISIFSFSSSVLALTKINFKETENGQINMTLHFEEGFVGGIDITLKIKGNVNVQQFEFSEKIMESNYESEYIYDKDNNTLTIHVTTGGIGLSHNLLNEKKELTLGTIKFSSTDKEDVVYNLEETSFKIIGNNWESQIIDKESIILGEESEFVYKVQEIVEAEVNPGESEDNPNIDEDNNDTEDTKPSESTDGKPNNSKNPGESNNQKPSEDKEDNKDKTDDSDSLEDLSRDNDNTPWLVLGIVVGLLIICIVIYNFIKKKNNN